MEPPSRHEPATPPGMIDESETLGLADVVVIAFGTLLAVPGVFLEAGLGGQSFVGILAFVVGGPLLEETLKPTGFIALLTRKPSLRVPATAGVLAGAFSGLVFAAIENLLYLHVYIENPGEELILWRWTVCVALHVGCSALVGYGLARSSSARSEEKDAYPLLESSSAHLLEEPRERGVVYQGISLRFLVLAVVLHGAYNLTVIFVELRK